ncbi:MAG: HAD-IA family hydrolase [Pseudobdellovibrio sp.]
MKKLIIFDCDGTLVDSEIIASEVFPAVWSEMGLTMSADFFISNFVGTGNDADIVKTTMAKLPPNAMSIADQKFNEELKKRLQPVQGMKDLLKNITHEMCVASNSSLEYVNNALTSTELIPFFNNKIFSSRQLAHPKPAPDVFLHAAKTLGFRAEECIVVEDSRSGIVGAKNAKMQVIGFMGGLHFNKTQKDKLFEAQADYYCSEISELRKYLF